MQKDEIAAAINDLLNDTVHLSKDDYMDLLEDVMSDCESRQMP